MDELDFPDLDYKIHADCSFPLSVPSQPPDIRNWFSSYQYESPDPSNPFHDLDETQDPLGGFVVQQQEDSPKFKEESCLKEDHILSKDSQNLVAATKRSDGEENGSIREEILKARVSGLKRKHKGKQALEEICTNDNGLPPNENSNNLNVEEDILQKKQSPKKCSNGEFIANASKDGFISTKKREKSSIVAHLDKSRECESHEQSETGRELRAFDERGIEREEWDSGRQNQYSG